MYVAAEPAAQIADCQSTIVEVFSWLAFAVSISEIDAMVRSMKPKTVSTSSIQCLLTDNLQLLWRRTMAGSALALIGGNVAAAPDLFEVEE